MRSEAALAAIADPRQFRIIVLPPTRADGLAMDKLLAASGMTCTVSAGIAQVCAEYRAGAGAIVISEEALVEDAAELLSCLNAQPVWSDLPVIVLSRSGHESATMLRLVPKLGNVSVVERPVRTSTLVSLVRAGLRARDRQYQMREYLARQEQAQRLIREGEQRYRSVIENVTDYAIFMTDAAGQISTWNEGAEAILGYATEEVLGKSGEMFFSGEDNRKGVMALAMQEAQRSGRAASARWIARKEGRSLFIEGVLTPVRDDSGRLLGFAHFLRDMTEKHQRELEREQLLQSERSARTEAERASRMKDEFLATLSHELRTPLNAILGWTQVLFRSAGLKEEAANALAVIERNARAQAQIIEDLLDMSGIISGKIRLDVQNVDLASVIHATLETVKPAAQAKGVRLQLVLNPSPGGVRGDPNRLQQVFWNLFTNAVKFTHKGGRVLVSLARVNSHVEVEVADNGEGIDPAFLPHIFDRFRQADSSTARRHGGLGLGLSIVKQLVELHGGSISAHSSGKGAGATLRVTLPVMAAIDSQPEASSSDQQVIRSSNARAWKDMPHADLTGLKILVVDDEADARALIERLLTDCDATVVTAASAAEAVRLLERDAPDVLVSDIGMPGEDGYALMRSVRAMAEGKSLPAIALSAYARTEDRIKTIHAGFQLHLAKPVEAAELVAMIRSLATAAKKPPH